MFKKAIAATAVALLAAAPVSAQLSQDEVGENTPLGAEGEQGKVEVGTLTCELAAVTNVLIYAKETFNCTFENGEGVTEAYEGKFSKIGANLQLKDSQTIKWLVVAPATLEEPGLLEGTYVGASAEAAVGVGAGARVLVGGSEDQFALQPVSVSGETGIGASLTFDSLSLEHVAG